MTPDITSKVYVDTVIVDSFTKLFDFFLKEESDELNDRRVVADLIKAGLPEEMAKDCFDLFEEHAPLAYSACELLYDTIIEEETHCTNLGAVFTSGIPALYYRNSPAKNKKVLFTVTVGKVWDDGILTIEEMVAKLKRWRKEEHGDLRIVKLGSELGLRESALEEFKGFYESVRESYPLAYENVTTGSPQHHLGYLLNIPVRRNGNFYLTTLRWMFENEHVTLESDNVQPVAPVIPLGGSDARKP